jgi:GntR family transcriptional regulator
VLRQQIHAGAYPDGLPTEQKLAAEFFVSRNTIREALGILKYEGDHRVRIEAVRAIVGR